jgi:hypothetical protein
VEEHTVVTKRVLTYLIYLVIVVQTLLCLVDGFPAKLSLLTIGSHVVYLQNLRHFPAVKLTDPLFILSCGSCLQLSAAVMSTLADSDSPSARARKPLALVLPLPSPANPALESVLVLLAIQLRPVRLPDLLGSERLLWSLRLACPILSLCQFVRWRECAAEYGKRICDWGRELVCQCWEGTSQRQESQGGHGKGACKHCKGMGWRDWRSFWSMERRKSEEVVMVYCVVIICMVSENVWSHTTKEPETMTDRLDNSRWRILMSM